MKKYNIWLGISAVVMSTITIITMAELRSDGYNHFHKAISELGSLDVQNRWFFNVFGYFIPGIFIAVFAYNLRDEFRDSSVRAYPFYLFLLSGLLLALAGLFPADMENRDSLTSIIHSVGSLGSGLCWLVCALTLWWQLKKDKGWKVTAVISFIIPFVVFILIILVPENIPGIAQRISFAGYYLFILLMAIKATTINH